MKILLVTRDNVHTGGIAPFARDHAESLRQKGHEAFILPVVGKGVAAYARYILTLNRYLKTHKVDVIHALYVYCGITTIFQNHAPVVITFIGCDFNRRDQRLLSKATICWKAKTCIFVNEDMASLYRHTHKKEVICFGVDLKRFYPMAKKDARLALGWMSDRKYILFASSFDRPEKNATLAFSALRMMNDASIDLVEFINYRPEEINFLYNACDLLLMTSIREGSPGVIKEAMACNAPIVTTDVGDVRQAIGDLAGCYLTSFDPADVAAKIRLALDFGGRTQARSRIVSLKLDLDTTTDRIIDVYRKVSQ